MPYDDLPSGIGPRQRRLEFRQLRRHILVQDATWRRCWAKGDIGTPACSRPGPSQCQGNSMGVQGGRTPPGIINQAIIHSFLDNDRPHPAVKQTWVAGPACVAVEAHHGTGVDEKQLHSTVRKAQAESTFAVPAGVTVHQGRTELRQEVGGDAQVWCWEKHTAEGSSPRGPPGLEARHAERQASSRCTISSSPTPAVRGRRRSSAACADLVDGRVGAKRDGHARAGRRRLVRVLICQLAVVVVAQHRMPWHLHAGMGAHACRELRPLGVVGLPVMGFSPPPFPRTSTAWGDASPLVQAVEAGGGPPPRPGGTTPRACRLSAEYTSMKEVLNLGSSAHHSPLS